MCRWWDIEHLLWRARNPSVRRCPMCKLTWETVEEMRMQDGVCHDCFDPFEHPTPLWGRPEGSR